LFAGDVFDQGDVAEFAAGCLFGLLRRCAAIKTILLGHCKMAGEFVLEFALFVLTAPREKIHRASPLRLRVLANIMLRCCHAKTHRPEGK
jgi:hypothetical protein